MHPLAVVEAFFLAVIEVEAEDIHLQRMYLVAHIYNAVIGFAESRQIAHHPIALSELALNYALGVHEVKVLIAILLAPIDKTLGVPRNEGDGVQWLGVAVVVFAVERSGFLARSGAVGVEARVGLVAIDLDEIKCGAIGAPGYVGEIAVGGVAKVEVYSLAGGHVHYAHGHFVRSHSRHRIFVGLIGG